MSGDGYPLEALHRRHVHTARLQHARQATAARGRLPVSLRRHGSHIRAYEELYSSSMRWMAAQGEAPPLAGVGVLCACVRYCQDEWAGCGRMCCGVVVHMKNVVKPENETCL